MFVLSGFRARLLSILRLTRPMALIRPQAEDLIEIYRGRGLARSEPVQLARFSSELHRHPSVNRACAFHVCGVVLSCLAYPFRLALLVSSGIEFGAVVLYRLPRDANLLVLAFLQTSRMMLR